MLNSGMVCVASETVIEVCEEGSLVFDCSSGSTTLLNEKALFLLSSLRRLGRVTEEDLFSLSAQVPMWNSFSDFSQVLSSLEEARLVARC